MSAQLLELFDAWEILLVREEAQGSFDTFHISCRASPSSPTGVKNVPVDGQ